MSNTEVLERTTDATTIRAGDEGQELRIPHVMPILPVRNTVVFPGTVMPLGIERPKSKQLIDEVMPANRLVGVVAQRNPASEDPQLDEIYPVGTICAVLKLFRLPDGNKSIIVHGLVRFRILGMIRTEPYLAARIEILEETLTPSSDMAALLESVRQQAHRVIELSPKIPDEAADLLRNITSPSAVADFLAANLPQEKEEVADKQALLEELDVEKRLRAIAGRIATHLDLLELQSKIQKQISDNIDRSQRRIFLQEQLNAIKKELGDGGEGAGSDIDAIKEKLATANPPEAVMKEANRELGRLEGLPSISPEYGVIRTYLQILADLPWNVATTDKLDLNEARRILDRDHFNLDKVKRRIIEYLAVRKLKPDVGGAILCFVGPPGVGKTSLGKSIAEAMGRRFVRMALGGIRDEADIRGHRRTYIGSMPGRIIAELRKVGTNNPVMMLDEIDKLGVDFRGDPAAALLEVLDPAQNHTFTDHYLDVPFDLSKVLFIATANVMDPVPPALRDRMEVIEIPGYTANDKLAIAKSYLVPRQIELSGLTPAQVSFSDDALNLLIDGYTREAGVRSLERAIGSVVRAVAAEIVSGKTERLEVDRPAVERLLGPRRFDPELAARTSVPGVATGLAYTPSGGEILFIEATRMAGRGKITLTGQIGDVMKESATAAFSLVRARAHELGISSRALAESDIHVHVPAGAVPKDGPSAGVAMFTALASLLLGEPVRHDVAMTGEITLRGLVLPIGGVKEKVLAAIRAGITHVILPKRNEKDLPDIPEEARRAVSFHWVETVDEALEVALGHKVQPRPRGATTKRTRARKVARHRNGREGRF